MYLKYLTHLTYELDILVPHQHSMDSVLVSSPIIHRIPPD